MSICPWKVKDGVVLEDIIRTTKNHIGQDWTTLARCTGMTKTDIDAIRYNNVLNLVEQIHQFFEHWKRSKGNAATAQALVTALFEELRASEAVTNLKKNGLIERKGLGGSKPSQVSPVMESNSSPQNTSLIPVQETNNTPHKPRSLRIADSDFHGDDAEVDNYQTDRPIAPLSAEERRIKKLKYESQEETGQGPFEDDHMIKVQQGYGVLKCVFEVDNKLMAGVELEDPKPGQGNGIYEGKRYFQCELGLALFIPYNQLQGDDRFEDVHVPEGQDTSDEADKGEHITQTLESIPLEAPEANLTGPEMQPCSLTSVGASSLDTASYTPSVEEVVRRTLSLEEGYSKCKYLGCSKARYKKEDGTDFDFCGKTHSEAYRKLHCDDVSVVAQERTCIQFNIPEDRTGLVIGRSGKNITKVQNATNTIIQISNVSIGGKNTGTITGSPENCERAAVQIMELIAERTAMHTATTKTIPIPDGDVGRVIGRGGATLRHIKAMSGVQEIEFDKTNNLIRTCSITGTDEQIEEAIKLIKQVQDGRDDVVSGARVAAHLLANYGILLREPEEAGDQCVVS